MFYRDDQAIYRVRPLDAFDWLEHGFGTRSSPDLQSRGGLATLHQVHSKTVVDAGGRCGRLGDGDALIESHPGHLVAVKTADCLPIVIVDPAHRAVAAVHAGWRGTVQKIAYETIAAMQEKFSSRPEQLQVAIGPGIGRCCYEVGPEVADQFRQYDSVLNDRGQPAHLDLALMNRRQVEQAGVPPEQIYLAGLCTMCNAEFHSFRRERAHAGRMLSWVGIRGT